MPLVRSNLLIVESSRCGRCQLTCGDGGAEREGRAVRGQGGRRTACALRPCTVCAFCPRTACALLPCIAGPCVPVWQCHASPHSVCPVSLCGSAPHPHTVCALCPCTAVPCIPAPHALCPHAVCVPCPGKPCALCPHTAVPCIPAGISLLRARQLSSSLARTGHLGTTSRQPRGEKRAGAAGDGLQLSGKNMWAQRAMPAPRPRGCASPEAHPGAELPFLPAAHLGPGLSRAAPWQG